MWAKMIEIEAGIEESLVEAYGGYKVEFGSSGRGELGECAEFKAYVPGIPTKIRNSELFERDIDEDVKSLAHIYGRDKRSCIVGDEEEVGGGIVDAKSFLRGRRAI